MPMCMTAQIVKIAVVNIQDVYDACPEKVAAQAALSELSQQYKQEYKLMQDDFGKKYADYQRLANDPKVSATIKERRMNEIQDEDDKVKQFLQQVDKELADKKAELNKEIYAKINVAVKAVGEAGDFTYIFDISQTPLAYTGPTAIDLTQLVKERLGLKWLNKVIPPQLPNLHHRFGSCHIIPPTTLWLCEIFTPIKSIKIQFTPIFFKKSTSQQANRSTSNKLASQ